MQFRKHFGYDVEEASNAAATPVVGESMTVQSMSEEADINVLMHRYGITGKLPDNPRVPVFGDFNGINDYQSALNAISNAHDAFMEYPAAVRARFDNDPQKMLQFCADGANYAEALKLGLVKERSDGGQGKFEGSAGGGVPVQANGGRQVNGGGSTAVAEGGAARGPTAGGDPAKSA